MTEVLKIYSKDLLKIIYPLPKKALTNEGLFHFMNMEEKMINWFNEPSQTLSPGSQFEIKELEVTENGEYKKSGEVYSKVSVNVSGSGLPSVTSADIGKGLSVQYVKGDVLIPQAEYTFNEENEYAVVLGTTCPEWFTEGATLYADIDGTVYKGVVVDDEDGPFASFNSDALVIGYKPYEEVFALYGAEGETGTNTITIYGESVEWDKDPYVGYDIVFKSDKEPSSATKNDIQIIKGSLEALESKLADGKPINAIAFFMWSYSGTTIDRTEAYGNPYIDCAYRQIEFQGTFHITIYYDSYYEISNYTAS